MPNGNSVIASILLYRALRAVETCDHRLCTERALKRSYNRAIIHLTNNNSTRILKSYFISAVRLIGYLRYKAVYLGRYSVGYHHNRRYCVSAIVGRGDLVSPVILTWSYIKGLVHRMAVFALTVKHLAKLTRLIKAAHFHTSLCKGIVLCYHIYFARFLNGAAKLNALADSSHSNTLRKNVLARSQRLNSEFSMLVEIVSKNNRVDVCLCEHFIIVGIKLYRLILVIVSALTDGKLFLVSIAYSHKLHSKLRGWMHKNLTSARTNYGILNRFHS